MTAKRQRGGLTRLDPEKLERQALRAGLSKTQLADDAGISRNTVLQAFRGEGIFNSSAKAIAGALGIEDVNSLTFAAPEAAGQQNSEDGPESGEWGIDGYLGGWITASNQLQFRVCRMRHRFVVERLGRGKWYDLLHLSHRDRESLREHLLRHAVVCERVGTHRNVSSNISTTPGKRGESWWVVDRWIDGTTLESELAAGPIKEDKLPRLMDDIACGLQRLHEAKVVFRELAPSRVILAADDDRAVLTDFELAKLNTGPSVSADWPDDPYRGPEVEGGHADVRSDLYSWGRILVHAATGVLPPKGGEFDTITQAGLPKAVWKTAVDCLSPGASERPKGIEQVIRALRRWSQ